MLFLFFGLGSASYESRRLTTAACPLNTTNCGFSGTSNTRHRLAFGATCTLNFTNCKVGACYGIIDWSYNMRWGYTTGINQSAFSSFSMTGVSVLNVSSAGAYFKPSSSNVTLTFTVQTCDNFYKLHPFERTETCDVGPEISTAIRGPPLCGADTLQAFGQPL